MSDVQETSNPFISPNPHRTSAFISYSRDDRKYLDELHDHLAYFIRTWNLQVWDNTHIPPGANWREETEKALQSTKVAVLLVSANYLASDSIAQNELATLMKAAKQDEVTILCVILGFCPFEATELSQFQAVNDPSSPLSTMSRAQRTRVWDSVARLVQKALSGGQDEHSATPPGMGNKTASSPKNRVNASQPAAKPTLANQGAGHMPAACDVCVVCAMGEEVEAFIREAARLYKIDFNPVVGSRTRRDYRYTTIQNNLGESLIIYVTWPPKYGPEETSLHLKAALDELQPRFAAMTGICAGNREKTSLGDIIVAERAFRYNAGKIILDPQGQKQQEFDTNTYGPDANTLQFAHMFDAWEPALAGLKRHASKRQQRDWLLSTLLQDSTPCVDDIPLRALQQHARDWRMIVQELKRGTDPYLNDDGSLRDKAQVRRLSRTTDFPYKDPKLPRRYIVPMASGSAVRSDNPFEDIRTPVRGTIAIDMEGATFYRTVMEFPGTRSLLVKGVSDYADPDKDDSYHQYAAAASSAYMLRFITEYVNSERLPKK
jgi:nucleoside phosphorylase